MILCPIKKLNFCTIKKYFSKATILYAIFDRLGLQAYNLGYKTESAILLSLFADCDLPDRQQLFADLGIQVFYNSLKDAQKEFDTVSKQKSDEVTLQDNESEAATQILNEIFPPLTSLVAMVQLYSQMEPETYSESYNQIVTCTTEINTVARARKTRRQNSNDATNTTPPVN
jgi:hypothetical protein